MCFSVRNTSVNWPECLRSGRSFGLVSEDSRISPDSRASRVRHGFACRPPENFTTPQTELDSRLSTSPGDFCSGFRLDLPWPLLADALIIKSFNEELHHSCGITSTHRPPLGLESRCALGSMQSKLFLDYKSRNFRFVALFLEASIKVR